MNKQYKCSRTDTKVRRVFLFRDGTVFQGFLLDDIDI
jgi:hypothetical protein